MRTDAPDELACCIRKLRHACFRQVLLDNYPVPVLCGLGKQGRHHGELHTPPACSACVNQIKGTHVDVNQLHGSAQHPTNKVKIEMKKQRTTEINHDFIIIILRCDEPLGTR